MRYRQNTKGDILYGPPVMLEVGPFWVSTSLHQNISNCPTFNIHSSVFGIHLVTPKQLKLPNF